MPKVDLKGVRADLLEKKQQLESMLKEHSKHFDLLEKARYKKAILQVGAAHLFLKHLDCDPPNMSFEFPPLPAVERAVRFRDAAEAKKAKNAKKGKKGKKGK